MENKKAFIYEIYSTDGDIGDVYIGSTTSPIKQRLCGHKVHYRNWKQGIKTHMASFVLFEKYGLDNCFIRVLAEIPYNKIKLQELERHYIDYTLCINIQLPGRTKKQYAIDKKEHLKNKAKELFNKK